MSNDQHQDHQERVREIEGRLERATPVLERRSRGSGQIQAPGSTDTIDCPVYSTVMVCYETEDRDAEGRNWSCPGSLEGNVDFVIHAPTDLRYLLDRCRELEHAARTRLDYDLRCWQCGAPHWIDTSLPIEVWNRIARPEELLCMLCIDERLANAGIETDQAEFYYAGRALRGITGLPHGTQHGVLRVVRQLKEAYDRDRVERPEGAGLDEGYLRECLGRVHYLQGLYDHDHGDVTECRTAAAEIEDLVAEVRRCWESIQGMRMERDTARAACLEWDRIAQRLRSELEAARADRERLDRLDQFLRSDRYELKRNGAGELLLCRHGCDSGPAEDWGTLREAIDTARQQAEAEEQS